MDGRLFKRLKNLSEAQFIHNKEDAKQLLDHGEELWDALIRVPGFSYGLAVAVLYPDPISEEYKRVSKEYPIEKLQQNFKSAQGNWEVGRVGEKVFIARMLNKPSGWLYLTQKRI